MKLAEITDLSLNEISDELKKSRLELVNLRMKFVSRQLEDPSQIKKKRKEIARLLTVHTQKLKTTASPDEVKSQVRLYKQKISLNKEKGGN